MENESENIAAVIKSGEMCIQTVIGRSTDGLSVNVWALPRVEDFMRSLGSGEHIDIQTLSRYWLPSGPDKARKMFCYDLSKDIGPLTVGDKFSYRIDCPGSPIINPAAGGDGGDIHFRAAVRGGGGIAGGLLPHYNMKNGETLNLSFLRLVGISEAGGVGFTIRGVYTREQVDRLADKIEQASNRFYREFLKPYKLIVTVSTMPIPVGYPSA